MNNIKTIMLLWIPIGIFVILALSFISFFFYLIDTHYPYDSNNWTYGEQTAFVIFLAFGTSSSVPMFFLGYMYFNRVRSTSTKDGGDVLPELIELNEIIYPNEGFDFTKLKTNILNLKFKELDPQLKTSQTQLTKLITELRNKVNNDLKAIIDLYLQVHAQIIAQNKEHDIFAKSQLTNFEDALQNHLTKEELQSLRTQQKETLTLEQHREFLENH